MENKAGEVVNDAVEDKNLQKVEGQDPESAESAAGQKYEGDLAYLNQEPADKEETDTDETENTEDTDAGEPDKVKTHKSGIEKRFHRFTKENYKLKEEIELLKSAIISKNGTPDNKRVESDEIKKPRREDFEDIRDFDEAQLHYSALLGRDLIRQEMQQKQQHVEAQKINDTWKEKVKVSEQRYSDFNEIKNADLPITPHMRNEMMTSDIGPDIAYYLYKNPEICERISNSTPSQQIKSLALIEDRVGSTLKTYKKVPNVSSAPDPITPTRSSNRSAPRDTTNESYQEFKRRREKEIRHKKGK